MGRTGLGLMLVLAAVGAGTWWLITRDTPTDEVEVAGVRAEPKAREAPTLIASDGAAAKRPPAPEVAPVAVAADDPLRREFAGSVIDDQQRPVAGAEVRLLLASTEATATARTAEDGTYLLVGRAPSDSGHAHGQIVARHGARVGYALAWLGTDDGRGGRVGPRRRVEPITLKEALTLDVLVRSRCTGKGPARVAALLSAAAAPVASQEVDGSGAARLEGLTPGPWRIVAAAEGCGRVEALVTLPRADAAPLVLELPEARTVTVSVVEKGTGTPVPGATVDVEVEVRFPEYMARVVPVTVPSRVLTGPDGRAVLPGFGPDDVVVLRASAPGFPLPTHSMFHEGGGTNVARAPGGQTEARIELARARTVAWPVKEGTAAIPADGTELRLVPWTNSGVTNVPPVGRMEGGRVVVTGWGPGSASAYAIAPGGAMARLSSRPDAEVGDPVAFHVVRSIEVRVMLEGEGPARGWHVTAHDQGNNPIAPAVLTDAEGVARLTDLYGGPGHLVDVRVSRTSMSWGGTVAGTVDLGQRDGRMEVTVPRRREVVLAVRVEGRASLPAGGRTVYMNGLPPEELAWDETAAEVRFHFQPMPGVTQATATLTVAGYLPAVAKMEVPSGGEVLRGALDLMRAGSLLARVTLPADKRVTLVAQAFDEAKGAWPFEPYPNAHNSMAVQMGGRVKPDSEGVATFPGLRPGRYRVFDGFSGITSAEVQVSAGGVPAEVSLDLSRSGWVRGRVEAPPGESIAGATVALAHASAAPALTGLMTPMDPAGASATMVDKEGAFWFRVPGDKPLRLVARHPNLRPDPRDGTVEVTGAREGVVLRLVRGPTAVIRFEQPLMQFMNLGSARPLAARLYEGEPTGTPKATFTAMLEGDGRSATLGGFDPGTYTVWIDTPPYAPLVLRNVTLAEGETDLGVHAPPVGARFVLEVKVKEGQDPPRYSIWLMREDDITVMRSGELWSKPEAVVTGLTKGRWTLRADPYAGGKPLGPEVIEFDDTGEVRRTIDLR